MADRLGAGEALAWIVAMAAAVALVIGLMVHVVLNYVHRKK